MRSKTRLAPKASKQKGSPWETIARRRSVSRETRVGWPLRRRPAQVGLPRDARGLAVAPAAATLPADVALAERRAVDQAEDRLAGVEQRDERREERNAAREADRPIDRIDQPAGAVRGALGAELLAEDGVVGEGAAQVLADHPLGGLVGLGDGGAIGLGLDRDAAEARQDLAAGEVRGALRRLGDGLEIQGGHGVSG
jgi:hypothetical protein